MRQAERDQGLRSGPTSTEQERIRALEREVRELRQGNEILRKASAYFAQAELDDRPVWPLAGPAAGHGLQQAPESASGMGSPIRLVLLHLSRPTPLPMPASNLGLNLLVLP